MLQDIPKSYRAKIQIVEHMSPKEQAASQSAFQGASPADSLIAGAVKYGDELYKTWSEDVLNLPSLRVISRKYEMHPLQSQLAVEMANGARAFFDRMGDTGHNCRLGATPLSTALESLISHASNLVLVGLVHEDGMVLRNWQMEAPQKFNRSCHRVTFELDTFFSGSD